MSTTGLRATEGAVDRITSAQGSTVDDQTLGFTQKLEWFSFETRDELAIRGVIVVGKEEGEFMIPSIGSLRSIVFLDDEGTVGGQGL